MALQTGPDCLAVEDEDVDGKPDRPAGVVCVSLLRHHRQGAGLLYHPLLSRRRRLEGRSQHVEP